MRGREGGGKKKKREKKTKKKIPISPGFCWRGGSAGVVKRILWANNERLLEPHDYRNGSFAEALSGLFLAFLTPNPPARPSPSPSPSPSLRQARNSQKKTPQNWIFSPVLAFSGCWNIFRLSGWDKGMIYIPGNGAFPGFFLLGFFCLIPV